VPVLDRYARSLLVMSVARLPHVVALVVGVATLLGVLVVPARAVTIDWVTVGVPGNAADTTADPNPAGAVADSFQIMKYEFTNQQYTDFLNAVDPSGTNPFVPSDGGDNIGFRLAAPVAVPEPSTCTMALAGLACGGANVPGIHRPQRFQREGSRSPSRACFALCFYGQRQSARTTLRTAIACRNAVGRPMCDTKHDEDETPGS
jgi:hypothetical protein